MITLVTDNNHQKLTRQKPMLRKIMRKNKTQAETLKKALLGRVFATVFMFLLFNTFTSDAYARGNYHVEVIVFKQLGSNPGNRPPTFTDLPSFSSTWKGNNVYLNRYAKNMRDSGKYQILTHTAWGQKSAPYNKSAAKALNIAGISGFIKIFATQLLIADIKLNFEGHKLSERRRLKLKEVHYFDNNGFGVLMRVSRL